MSQALAAVGSTSPSLSVESVRPVVFIDGIPEPDLSVTRFTNALALDTRSASLQWLPESDPSRVDLLGSVITIAVPYALSDGEARWRVLLAGSVSENSDAMSVGNDSDELEVQDALAALLDEPVDTLSPWPDSGLGLDAFVQRVADLIQAQAVFACEDELLDEPIESSSPQKDTVGRLLAAALSNTGLRVEQTLRFVNGGASRTLTLIPVNTGREAALPWPDDNGRGGAVGLIAGKRASRPPRAWTAQGDRPVIEDTFDLLPGWDPALQGQPDSDYGRLTSTDFSRFGSVYRAWVLNEDGAFTDPPFNQGEAFDVGALFDEPGTVLSPLRFRHCLTEDASGRAIAPLIESSTDSGVTWSAYPGTARVMNERAGVLLNDDDLPAAILSAAKAGTLRIRVTATLTSPDPIEARRWDGNPFAGSAPTRVLNFGDRFAWRRVAASSIHAGSIDAGLLAADTVDDRVALRAALQLEIAQHTSAESSVTAELIGAWTMYRPGDRVREVLAPGIAIDGSPAHFDGRRARIREVRVVFGVSNRSPRTRITME